MTFKVIKKNSCNLKLNTYAVSYRLTVCKGARRIRAKENVQMELNSYKE